MVYRPTYLPVDGTEYDILYEASKNIIGVPGFTCEIGLREGGGSEAIMQGSLDAKDKRIHIAIDPFGDIPYAVEYPDAATEAIWKPILKYPNQMKRKCLPNIYLW